MQQPLTSSESSRPELSGEAPAQAEVAYSQRALAPFALPVMFAATLFVSASLVFTVEPMFAKMVLPRLGGSPAVWNTCVVFFQAAMLAGYAYAHVTSRWLTLGQQVALHVGLILTVGLTLPVAIAEGWAPPVDRTPIPALLLLLLVGLGGPFAVVSSTAPLLQKWFSHTEHFLARDPYFLYAASNLGSIVALLGYPLVVEPLWPLSGQSFGWTIGYAVFAVMTATCAVTAVRFRSARQVDVRVSHEEISAVTWSRRARWLGLAAVPSSLMLGVTTFLSTDVAAMPLLWTVPLALYLLTFVVAFSVRPLVPPRLALGAMTVLALPLVLTITLGIGQPLWLLMPLHLAGFLACALVLHGELARDRPDTRHLTEFYLWISFGGLVGGTFNTLVAPVVFASVIEYPLAFVLACALRPRSRSRSATGITLRDAALPLAFGLVAMALLVGVKSSTLGVATGSVGVGVIVTLYMACTKRPLRLAGGLLLVVLGNLFWVPHGGTLLHAERTFFGVLRVDVEPDRGVHRLFHGNTLHGEQSLDPSRRREPLSYYHPTGPIGQMFEALSDRFQRVAVVGLGAGSLAAYARQHQQWTFYEIDPAVERIARTPRFFTYLNDCGDVCQVVLGDARLSLASAEDARYDAIILDAFSSDAIPIHLLTRQAFQLYLSRLSEFGIIGVHISSRYLRLAPVLGALAADLSLVVRVQVHRPENDSEAQASQWVIMARSEDDFGSLATDARWSIVTARSSRVWTDDYSDILGVLGREPS